VKLTVLFSRMSWLADVLAHVRRRFASKVLRRSVVIVASLGVLAFLADRLFPLPMPGRSAPFALIVTARDGTPLRAFPDKLYIWRNPVTLDQVSPLYIDAVIRYEDKAFWWHFGINPFALLRASWQWLRYGRVISGGSTLTMQVARMLDPMPRSVFGKFRQMLRALQLEAHYSKREILTLYMNYAPMGGVLEGVDAASRAYLGKPPTNLSHAEAALLAVLPQTPSLLRPDRFPERAQRARDKLLRRVLGHWTQRDVNDALSEPVYALKIRDPMLAPLLAERLKQGARARSKLKVTSTIDAGLQGIVEMLLLEQAQALPRHVSCAALVMDNTTLEVLAYSGSSDFNDIERAGHVDMVRAWRSPGSTLKPFLYGFALDEGLISSESLLSDVPQSFGGYRPGNFAQSFSGAVSVSEALTRSLNVPAVQVLEQYGASRFVAKLRQGGLKLRFPQGAEPNLSVILGGVDTTLENLVAAYSSLAREGIAGQPRLTSDAPVEESRMMSAGAAFIIRDILEAGGTPENQAEYRAMPPGVALKTGTSYGFRDAWSVGVTDRYTVGVWIGRPDGTPNPGHFGANTAVPLLRSIFAALPGSGKTTHRYPPATVEIAKICWPLGNIAESTPDTLCATQRVAWLLSGIAPPTFPDTIRGGEPILRYTVDSVTGLRATADCTEHPLAQAESPLWPVILEPWLDARSRRLDPPKWAKGCAPSASGSGKHLAITGVNSGEIIHQAFGSKAPQVALGVQGSQGKVGWLLNGKLMGSAEAEKGWVMEFTRPGEYSITAFDERGQYDQVTLEVR
jgi:penicillin-binding protein 1C